MQEPNVAFMGAFMTLMVLGGIVLGVLLTVIPFWMICKKAGFTPALALLMLVPVANIILPFYIAFADWPALRRHDARPVQ
jgi:heme/copper-type cytochrome/quinol oxidase subunit 4